MRVPRPVTRAEDLYLPPPHLPADAWALVPPAERVVRWYEERQQRRILVAKGLLLLAGRLYARIDHGRWVASCTCMSAQIVTPADPRMWCVECGTGWWQLTFPDDVEAAEQGVALLPVGERNWWHPDDPVRPAEPEPEEPPAPENPEV
ncbi:hypothetical protein Q5762_13760 [Streptomyces sp. P9(2023)]|uniref:hypothetical protein n=1 Tax=Streptomyces sp. P9(2023) TaxID=3064394 RepID=UPI0028F44418|nr:hypothetical protein [Streptomyces sp. P9(2023)]MDT9689382.1 hypothetical protein [Streptomyces sp. P9(2023)]